MAKEQFQRTKPHVNVAVARHRLTKAGMSARGVQQLLAGLPISSQDDRTLLAQIAVQAASEFGMHFWPRVGDEVIVA